MIIATRIVACPDSQPLMCRVRWHCPVHCVPLPFATHYIAPPKGLTLKPAPLTGELQAGTHDSCAATTRLTLPIQGSREAVNTANRNKVWL
jgi:hypothetical protein